VVLHKENHRDFVNRLCQLLIDAQFLLAHSAGNLR